MINISKLHEFQNKRINLKHEIFQKILRKCHHRIITSTQKGDVFCFYPVPPFEFGVPLYNDRECCSFLIQKLVANGFLVKYVHPNLLYICWDRNHIGNYAKNSPSTAYARPAIANQQVSSGTLNALTYPRPLPPVGNFKSISNLVSTNGRLLS